MILTNGSGTITDPIDLSYTALPVRTRTYQPVGHLELVDMVKDIATQTIVGYRLGGEEYTLTKGGAEMFGKLSFIPSNEDATVISGRDMDLAIGIVNSYNKRVRVKFASGARVVVTNAMVFLGDVIYTRKHTPNVITDVKMAIQEALGRAKEAYDIALIDARAMRYVEVTDEQAHALLGLLFGAKVLNTPQLNASLKAWKSPTQVDFQPRSLWSLYNAVNIALTTSKPDKVMEKHIELHDLFVDFAKHRSLI